MTFKELVAKYNFSKRAYHGLFHLSNSVKNLNDYLLKQNQQIDFCPQIFHNWYPSEQPIERIVKEVYFYQLPLHLLDNVFCPRHETELLIEELNKLSPLKGNYIDICSGTGAIGIATLQNNRHLNTTLLDISPDAIENIHINLKRHRLNAQVILDDWHHHLTHNPNYQIITANFPYISPSDPIDSNLMDPPNALFADLNGWSHYQKLISHLKTNPHWKIVVLECSAHHEDRWKEVQELNIHLIKDINQLLRVAVITRPPNL